MKYFVRITGMEYTDKNKLHTAAKHFAKQFHNHLIKDDRQYRLVRKQISDGIRQLNASYRRCTPLREWDHQWNSDYQSIHVSGVFVVNFHPIVNPKGIIPDIYSQLCAAKDSNQMAIPN